jgi:hypothetical protein
MARLYIRTFNNSPEYIEIVSNKAVVDHETGEIILEHNDSLDVTSPIADRILYYFAHFEHDNDVRDNPCFQVTFPVAQKIKSAREKLLADYEIDIPFDPVAVQLELEQETWEVDLMNDHLECKRVFIGTVFALTPSGKYYTPYANSNVTEFEAMLDETFWDAVETLTESYDFFLESGEGDPCDIFAAQYRDRDYSPEKSKEEVS